MNQFLIYRISLVMFARGTFLFVEPYSSICNKDKILDGLSPTVVYIVSQKFKI